MGIPYRRFLAASNANNSLVSFMHCGHYDVRHRKLSPTMSPAIDILVPSNLERLIHALAKEINDATLADMVGRLQHLGAKRELAVPASVFARLTAEFEGEFCSEDECALAIRSTYQCTGRLLDPHTAVAKVCADKRGTDDVPLLLASTAHWTKFAGSVAASLGQAPNELLVRTQHEPRSHEALGLLMEKAGRLKVEPQMASKSVMEMLIRRNSVVAKDVDNS